MGVEIKDKLLLTIQEASKYSGIGTNKLYELVNTPRCEFVMFVGKRRMIKRVAFEKFIAECIEI